MLIGVLGVNHKCAELRLREKLAKACERRFHPSHAFHADFSYVLLSTCNRTEIYFSADDLASTHTYLLGILRGEVDEPFEHRLYSYFGSDCFSHLAAVTAGIDSAMPFETEIQCQVKQAYEISLQHHLLTSELHFLFQKCLKIGKYIRSIAPLRVGMPSLEEIILQITCHAFNNPYEKKILFVGLSKINQNIFKKFKQKNFKNVTFCNRTPGKLDLIKTQEAIECLPWERIHNWTDFDLIIVGTTAPDFLIKKEKTFQTVEAKKLLIDLSVPRNVDPQLGRHPLITLLNVDQLNRLIDRKKKFKINEMKKNEAKLIAQEVNKQLNIFRLKVFRGTLIREQALA